jgi:hypothetical protein
MGPRDVAGSRTRIVSGDGVVPGASRSAPVIAALCCVLSCTLPARAGAQEISEASFVGSLVGAAEACAQAYPDQAGAYRDSLQRLVGCHFTGTGLRNWHEALRNQPATRPQYLEGLDKGRRSLDAAPSLRHEQCTSLMQLSCGPGTAPKGEQQTPPPR